MENRQTGFGTYVRLSGMMFLQFAIWGAWAVLIAGHMQNLGFTGKQISYVFGTTAIGSMISPIIAGWIADRLMPAQVFAAISHLLGGVCLLFAWRQTSFPMMWGAIFLHAVLYMPTIALTNAIAFHHMGQSDKFGNIRVFGTFGWIAINWALSLYLRYCEGQAINLSFISDWFSFLGNVVSFLINHLLDGAVSDCLFFGAILSFIMGIYCLTLPNTPPSKEAKNPYAFLEAFSLVSNRNFAVLLIISFVVAIELPFYYNLTYLFLTEAEHGVGLAGSSANFAMSLGQVAEVALMLLLFPCLRWFGMRWTIFLGILAWPVRYAIFAIGQPVWLVVGAQTLHGICYSFFFVGGMIAVERLSSQDIRASSQSLLLFVTNGFGMLVGHIISGRVHDFFAYAEGGHAWAKIFMVPIVVTVFAAIAFIALFDEKKYQADAEAMGQNST
ncbi:nucleoside permease [Candidatus Poribacteria bacterium]|nr:nucleoside permease [Candidatus Poribacteria bacterium]MYK20217.1 nucleoside permease [Candidatus Poribacteria bacterium]